MLVTIKSQAFVVSCITLFEVEATTKSSLPSALSYISSVDEMAIG